jgi:hypothetical protein
VTTLEHLTDAPPRTAHDRGAAALAGALYLLTFVTSVPTLALYAPVHESADFVLGAGPTTGVMWGAFLEVCLALSCVGTAVALFPVLRRYSEVRALGFVAARLLEAGLILVGVVSLLAVVSLRGEAVEQPDALVATGRALVAAHDWTFLLGQSLMPVVSALCLGTVLYRWALVPRIIPAVGLVGAPLLLASDLAVFAGLYEQRTALAGLAALPIAVWELAIGVRLLVKGFDPATPQTR